MLETQFYCKFLECLTTVVGPIIRSYYLGNYLLADTLSKHFYYTVAVALSYWYLPNDWIPRVAISGS